MRRFAPPFASLVVPLLAGALGLGCPGPGRPDAGAPDGGGLPDGGPGPDAGAPVDAGTPDAGGEDGGPGPDPGCPDVGPGWNVIFPDADGAVRTATLPAGLHCELPLNLTGGPRVVEVRAPGVLLAWGEEEGEEPGWLAPAVREAGQGTVRFTTLANGPVTFELYDHGAPRDDVTRERSLVWQQPALVDDPAVLGLSVLMARISDDGHGGRLLAAWFERFATTVHSERLGPWLLLQEVMAEQGEDPSTWDLDALPFKVTGVHNRLDLKNDEHCGELRVSVASIHPTYRPLHLLFLFHQPPRDLDRSPGGVLHCQATARAWAALSDLDEPAFLAAAQAWLVEGASHETFALAESVEFTVAPWEWRQWVWVANPDGTTLAELPRVFDNPPLFQTLDIATLNAPGPVRDAFLAFVEENAAALDARSLVLPASWRAPSARLNDGVPWTPLDLTGVDPAVLAAWPELRGHLEIVGCPACHTADAEFVQTREDRTFSDFYDEELFARGFFLRDLTHGVARPVPFGPLQDDPVLPPGP